MHSDRLYRRAVLLLKIGQPLPVDLTTYLLTLGIDVAALERRHAA